MRRVVQMLWSFLGLGPYVEHIRPALRRQKTTTGARSYSVNRIHQNGHAFYLPGDLPQGLRPEEQVALRRIEQLYQRLQRLVEENRRYS